VTRTVASEDSRHPGSIRVVPKIKTRLSRTLSFSLFLARAQSTTHLLFSLCFFSFLRISMMTRRYQGPRDVATRFSTSSTGARKPGHTLGHCQGTYPGDARARERAPLFSKRSDLTETWPVALCSRSIRLSPSLRRSVSASVSRWMRARHACYCSTSRCAVTEGRRTATRFDGHISCARNNGFDNNKRDVDTTVTKYWRTATLLLSASHPMIRDATIATTFTSGMIGGVGGKSVFDVTRPGSAIGRCSEEVASDLDETRQI